MTNEWARFFEGKSAQDIKNVEPPPGLSASRKQDFTRARFVALRTESLRQRTAKAADAERKSRQIPPEKMTKDPGQDPDQGQTSTGADVAPVSDVAADLEFEMPPPDARGGPAERENCAEDFDPGQHAQQARSLLPSELPPDFDPRTAPADHPLVIPEGSLDRLLERQVASCAGLIEFMVRYIAQNNTDPGVCANFMDRMSSLMKSSATVGKVAGRLRGLNPEETLHRMIVEHRMQEGEGVLRA